MPGADIVGWTTTSWRPARRAGSAAARAPGASSARLRAAVTYVALPLGLLTIWSVAVQAHWVSRQVLVSPADVARAFVELESTGELGRHLGRSMVRLVTGFGIGGFLGLVAGIGMGVSKKVEYVLGPVFEGIRQIPTIALIPAFILVLGVDESLKIVLVAKASFFPIALAARHGVRQVPRDLLEVARVYKLSPTALLGKLIVPSAIPPIVAGGRIALGRSWLVLVTTELMAAESGIGQMMETARQMFRMDVVMVGVFVTGAVGLALDAGVGAIERVVRRGRGA